MLMRYLRQTRRESTTQGNLTERYHTHTNQIDYVLKIKLEFVVLFGNANLNGENMLCDRK